MGIMEDMMEKMMGAMSNEERQKMMREAMIKMMAEMTSEDRQGMMEEMIKQFFGKMGDEEREKMMKGMMDGGMMSMMSQMAGGNSGEKEMMKMMRKCMSGDFEPPWMTMHTIMEEVLETCGFALVHTPELHTLFSEFLDRKGNNCFPVCLSSQASMTSRKKHPSPANPSSTSYSSWRERKRLTLR